MGKFFNQVLMPRKKIPQGNTSLKSSVERERLDFNKLMKTEPTLEDKRLANLAKAREAKKKKREANG